MTATFYISFQSLGMRVSGFLILLREFSWPFPAQGFAWPARPPARKQAPQIHLFLRVSLAMMPRAADLGHNV